MKNIYDVIRQKETDLQQLQKDLDILRAAGRLLADEADNDAALKSVPVRTTAPVVPRDNGPMRQFP